jgi:hypothetical protein
MMPAAMRRLTIPILIFSALTAGSSAVLAASIGSESSIGVAADADSNPYLLPSGAKAAEAAAFQADVPISYNGDENTFDLTPRVRFAETHGPAQLLTNYQYLDADWRFANERNTLTAAADWHHDSTLYNPFENSALNGQTVYRQQDLASLGWLRQLDERSDFQLSGSYDRINYDAAANATLSSYEYKQGTAQYDHRLGERWEASLTGGYGGFRLFQQNYRSQQEFGQVGLSRVLSERWSVKASLGYSWAQDRLVQPELFCSVNLIFCELGLYPFQIMQVTLRSSGHSANGQLTLQRHYERATFDLSGSRAIVPSGLGALVSQVDVSTSGTYQLSERWQLTGTLHGAVISNATAQSQIGTRRYGDLSFAGSWQWTEHWTLQMTAALRTVEINRQYAHGIALSVGAFRQFGRVRIH